MTHSTLALVSELADKLLLRQLCLAKINELVGKECVYGGEAGLLQLGCRAIWLL